MKRIALLSFMPAALALASLSGGALAADDAPAVPRFVEETGSAGIDSVYAGEWEYMVGGGAAAFDCDDDGFPDLLLAGGASKASFYRNASKRGGALAFDKMQSGLEIDGVTGAYPLDIDSDGVMDITLLRVGENIAMRGLGACRFENANQAWGFEGGDAWSTAFAATWEKGANWPTIAIGNYIDRTQEITPWGSCTDNWLHRPEAGAKATRFVKPIALTPSFCALSMLFTDWSRSGTPALRVSNDREYYEGGEEQLWRIEPGREPERFTERDGWKSVKIWGMGIASHDLNFDGYPEYFLTSMADNRLQTLVEIPAGGKPRPHFAEKAYPKGITAHRPYTGGETKPSTAWHAQFEDVNNDSRADLFIAKGNVDRMPDFAMKDPNNLLLQQKDGRFIEAGDKAGIASLKTARGAALADFNLDGLVDLVVVNRREKAQIWRNVSTDLGGSVSIALKQPAPNVNAIGAWIEVKCGPITLRREITAGGGHAGGHLGWWHFGLGDTEEASLRIIWPDGEASAWQIVESGRFYRITRDSGLQEWIVR
jgi:enediyne biosynthesis protein E4